MQFWAVEAFDSIKESIVCGWEEEEKGFPQNTGLSKTAVTYSKPFLYPSLLSIFQIEIQHFRTQQDSADSEATVTLDTVPDHEIKGIFHADAIGQYLKPLKQNNNKL
jgi:hypothetical protein